MPFAPSNPKSTSSTFQYQEEFSNTARSAASTSAEVIGFFEGSAAAALDPVLSLFAASAPFSGWESLSESALAGSSADASPVAA